MKKKLFLFHFLVFMVCDSRAQTEIITKVISRDTTNSTFDLHCTISNKQKRPILMFYQKGEIWKDNAPFEGAKVQLLVLQRLRLDEKLAGWNKNKNRYEVRVPAGSTVQVVLELACANKGFAAYTENPNQIKRTALRFEYPESPRDAVAKGQRCYGAQSIKQRGGDNKNLLKSLLSQIFAKECPNGSEFTRSLQSNIQTMVTSESIIFRDCGRELPFPIQLTQPYTLPPLIVTDICLKQQDGLKHLTAKLCFVLNESNAALVKNLDQICPQK
jgi:hypothetical protein